jgi:hypothetical protein
MDCPNCKLANPPDALRCDCGYDFSTGLMEASYLTEREQSLERASRSAGSFAWGMAFCCLPFLPMIWWAIAAGDRRLLLSAAAILVGIFVVNRRIMDLMRVRPVVADPPVLQIPQLRLLPCFATFE